MINFIPKLASSANHGETKPFGRRDFENTTLRDKEVYSYVFYINRIRLFSVYKVNEYVNHCLKEILYPPFAPCSSLKLSKLIPK